MRAVAGLAGLDLALLATGAAVLYGLGLRALHLAGLAFVVGWATVGIAVSLVLAAGLGLTVWQVLLLCLGIAGAGLLAGRRGGRPAPAQALSGGRWIALAGIALLAPYGVGLLLRSWYQGAPTAWDAWAVWIPKAKSIVYFNGIDTGPGGFTSFAHPHYPPLVPGMHAAAFRFAGSVDPTVLPLQDWALFAAFVAGVAGLLAPRVPAVVLWPSLVALALMPGFGKLVGTSLADLPLAILFALAGVCGALWLADGARRHLALAAILLAAAALTKAEGLQLGLLLGATLAVAALFARERPAWAPAATAAVSLSAVLPWKLWVSAHGLPQSTEYHYADLLDARFLAARLDRLGTGLAALPEYLLASDRWFLAVPLALASALLLVRRRSDLAVLAIGVPAAGVLGIAVIYWIAASPVNWYIETSGDRITASLTVFSGALAPLLLAEALEGD